MVLLGSGAQALDLDIFGWGKEKKEASTKKSGVPLFPGSFAELVEREKNAVVNISTTKIVKGPKVRVFRGFGPFDEFKHFFGDDFFERFFGEIPRGEMKEKSLGSGFVIDKEGYILTNQHVIEGAEEIKVKLSNGKTYDAKVIGSDKKTDIALIKIDTWRDLPVVDIGDSDKLRVGDWVVAIGNPFGLEHTVTAGIVSAKGRVIGAGPYDDFIQTDASINPGNSGGPLFNIQGEVVGINTAIIPSGQGIGFAIPINMAKDIIPQLREKGKVTRGWLGLLIQRVTPELAESFGLEEAKGALVADVVEDGPAAKAGIKRGDVIVSYDGEEIEDQHELSRRAAATPPGKQVVIGLIRDGKEMEVKVKVGEFPEDEEVAYGKKPEVGKKLGLTVQNLTEDLRRHFDIEEREGVLISDVEPGSPADEAGLKRGDLILEVNRKPITDVEDFEQEVGKVAKGESVLLLIKRGGNTLFFSVKVKKD